jgi:hypothetical protein
MITILTYVCMPALTNLAYLSAGMQDSSGLLCCHLFDISKLFSLLWILEIWKHHSQASLYHVCMGGREAFLIHANFVALHPQVG